MAALLLACGCEDAKRASPPWPGPGPKHVALIVLDTLRADHLGLYGYDRPTTPELDALGARGVVFDHAFSTSPSTLESVTSLFTGTAALVDPDQLPALEAIQTLFKEAGFATHAVIANPWLFSALFQEGFDHHWNGTDWGPNTTESVARMARKQIEMSAESGRRGFFCFHFLDPHDPYEAPERVGFYEGRPILRRLPLHKLSGEKRLTDRYEATGFLGKPTPAYLTDDELRFLEAEYDEEIRFLDRHLAAVVEAFEAQGMLEDTLIAVTSDHGEEFMDHGLLKHGFQLYDELVHVPLVLHWPNGLEPGRRDTLASGIDLPTTLLTAAGIDVPAQFQGFDLLAEERGEAPVPLRTHFVNQRQHGFRTLRHKWIRDHGNAQTEVYDVVADPEERTPIRDPETLAALEALWRTVESRYALEPASPATVSPMPDEVRKRLEALGYTVD
jgi:arylsulfatase A-like enzyme